MKDLKIKLDFSHGPIWKDVFDASTGQWSTGIGVIDHDKALSVLNDEAEKEYASLYSFDDSGALHFDAEKYKEKRETLISLVQTIILRVNDLNDGTYAVVDETAKSLQ